MSLNYLGWLRVITPRDLYIEKKLAQLLGSYQQKSIVDLGCGSGGLLYPFSSHNFVVSIDLDAYLLKATLKRNKAFTPVCADVRHIPIRSCMADMVVCFDVIEHVKEDDLVIKEIHRVLKQNGSLLLTTPSTSFRPSWLAKLRRGFEQVAMHQRIALLNERPFHAHLRMGYSLNDLKRKIANYLSIVTIETFYNFFSRIYTNVISTDIVMDRLPPHVIRSVSTLIIKLDRVFSQRTNGEFFVVAVKSNCN